MNHRLFTDVPRRVGVVRAGLRLAVMLVAGSVFSLPCPIAHAAEPTTTMAIDFLYGEGELFPSVIVSATAYCTYVPRSPQNVRDKAGKVVLDIEKYYLGDKQGVISVRISSTKPDSKVKVTLAETPYFAESSLEATLPEANSKYWIAPTIRYDHEKLAALKQPVANLVLKVSVELNGQTREFYPKIVLHSVNDWLVGYKPRGANLFDYRTKHLVAAFVNENSPLVDRVITKGALDRRLVPEFRGYATKDGPNKPQRVDIAEISAVYETLRSMGFHYTSVPQASVVVNRSEVILATSGQESSPTKGMLMLAADPARVETRYVRLAGDAMASRQANGLEAAVLLASVYRKLGLHTVLMVIRDTDRERAPTLLGVYTKRNLSPESLIVLDPELIGTEPFKEACQAGSVLWEKHKQSLLDASTSKTDEASADAKSIAEGRGFLWIDLGTARANGVLPIPEFSPVTEP